MLAHRKKSEEQQQAEAHSHSMKQPEHIEARKRERTLNAA